MDRSHFQGVLPLRIHSFWTKYDPLTGWGAWTLKTKKVTCRRKVAYEDDCRLGRCLVLRKSLLTFQRCSIALIMERATASKTSVDFGRSTRRSVPEDCHFHTRRCENLKFHESWLVQMTIYCAVTCSESLSTACHRISFPFVLHIARKANWMLNMAPAMLLRLATSWHFCASAVTVATSMT
jgi:hypothetical protein